MRTLIDTILWIDFTRRRSPQALKLMIAPYILDPAAHLAEPVAFEVLRHATPEEILPLTQQFATFPVLSTPPDIWTRAAEVGQRCRRKGVNAGSLDLVIAAVAIFHQVTLLRFDEDFQRMAGASNLLVNVLKRPT